MLWARVVIDANQPALENGKNTFDLVCGDTVTNEFAFPMVDGIVEMSPMPQ